MDRNIITKRDAAHNRETLRQRHLAAGMSEVNAAELNTRLVETQSNSLDADSWHKKLLKYTPTESIALYLTLDGIFRSAALSPKELRFWLGMALAISLLFTWLFLRRIWKVARRVQCLVSMFALVVYVFAIGGFFATFQFYQPWQGTALLVVTATFLVFYEPPGLVPAV